MELSEILNNKRALAQLEKLRYQHMLHSFIQDCDELQELIHEHTVLVQEDNYRSPRTINTKLTCHQAFASEIHNNKEQLDKGRKSEPALLAAKPEMAELVGPRMDDLTGQFDWLEGDTREKGERLFDAKLAYLHDQSCHIIGSVACNIEGHIETEPIEELSDLSSVNIMMQKQQLIETQMIVKLQQMTELEGRLVHQLRIEPGKQEQIKTKKVRVEERFSAIMALPEARKAELLKKEEPHHFKHDIEDENLWKDEKVALASSHEDGDTLQVKQVLLMWTRRCLGSMRHISASLQYFVLFTNNFFFLMSL